MNIPLRHASARLISDLHLAPERPEGVDRFLAYLTQQAVHSEALFILGDFFEFWVGDDTLDDPFNRDVARALKRLADAGVRIYFLPGNRDFLAGGDFAAAAGLAVLPDPCLAELGGIPTLLSHGDLLCTADAEYLAYRARTRAPAWQKDFLARPLDERLAFARQLRMQSEGIKASRAPEIMDVSQEAVLTLMRDHRVHRLIHGHTHRPAHHVFNLDGHPAERWVLPDWYEAGGGLLCDSAGCRPENLPRGKTDSVL